MIVLYFDISQRKDVFSRPKKHQNTFHASFVFWRRQLVLQQTLPLVMNTPPVLTQSGARFRGEVAECTPKEKRIISQFVITFISKKIYL